MSKFRYIAIGWVVYSFITSDEIIDFDSIIGNSWVPYSIGYGKDYIYLLEANVKIPRKNITTKTTNVSDLYNLYYNKTVKASMIKPRKVLIKRAA